MTDPEMGIREASAGEILNMQTEDVAQVAERVQGWPIPMRIALARQILESIEREPQRAVPATSPRGPSAAEIVIRFATGKPSPDDATVDRWIEEHRMTKHSS